MKRNIVVFLITVWVILQGCTIGINLSREHSSSKPTYSSWRCDPVPETFKESDLVGTWQTRSFGGAEIDTLFVHENGLYRRKYVNKSISYTLESELEEWKVERLTDDYGVYVHFQGMLYCMTRGNCIDPHDVIGFYDFCADRWFGMEGEFILAVVGDKETLRGIRLRHMRPAGSEIFFVNYTLIDE